MQNHGRHVNLKTVTPLPPKICELILDSERWSEVKERGAYEYPGFETEENHVNYCKDITKTVGFGSYQKPHFMWDDCQFTRRDTLTQKLNQQINTDKTEVWLKRTFCEGMYVPMKVAITL